ncbi:MAG: tetratricopeptide repeat protein [Candidatus Yanofskybacteria bacterium]|nr:tetratricopeptide repeat protein [Candidatus Yanofskybacteria bacterium]
MYLLIPLILILASAGGIFFIVWRKVPYLKKLTVTDVQSGQSIWSDLFPELANGVNSTRLKHYRGVWLLELEKFLRRLRLMSMKMDRMSDSLIKRIRNVTERKHPSAGVSPAASASPSATAESIRETVEDLKREEQKLIIEIAKDPKNSSLYEVLGDLYVKMSNFADAKESYEAAIELNPANEELKKKHSQAVENVVK